MFFRTLVLRTPARAAMGTIRRAMGTSIVGREPLLFTPGPLTTSATVKQAMLVDYGSRDPAFISLVQECRDGLLAMAGASQAAGYECVLMQGSGTFAIESVVGSVVPPPEAGGRILVCSNGAYGDRMAEMCRYYGIDHELLRFGERETVCPDAVARALAGEGEGGAAPFTHVGCIHHETTAGTLNDIPAIGAAVAAHTHSGSGAAAAAAAVAPTFIVDSMSGFGAYDLDLAGCHVHYLVSSSNKNIEGVPGFAFALCDRARLEAQGGHARSLALDLRKQWQGLEKSGQFRFTPPTHSLVAFRQALAEHEAEGGVAGRRARYEANAAVLKHGLGEMGFGLYVGPEAQGAIISTFLFPNDAAFDFEVFYNRLAELGIVIYPGKLTDADCFRIGSIGRLFEKDMLHMVNSVRFVLEEMGVALPVTQIKVETN